MSEGNSTGVCGAWIGGSNILIDGRQRLTKLLSWRGNLDEGQSAINCEMVAAFVMLYIMKHCVVGGMDIQFFPITDQSARSDVEIKIRLQQHMTNMHTHLAEINN